MSEEALLIGISQLAAVFAGFISIFMAFVQTGEKFSPADGVRARVIIYSSFVIVLAALLPMVIAALGASEPNAWRMAAVIYTAIGVLISFDIFRIRRALKQASVNSFESASSILSRLLNVAMFVIGLVVAFGLAGGGFYILLLTMNLTLAAISFIAFVTNRV